MLIKSNISKHFALLFLLCIFFFLSLYLGSVHISLSEIADVFLGKNVLDENNHRFIILHYRLPKSLSAILTGMGLSLSGLLIQTLFRNPLAGPYVLGVSSGAGLGVALLFMGLSAFGIRMGITESIFASGIGGFLVLVAILVMSRSQDITTVLIIGVMFSSLTGGIISILSYFSSSQELQQFVFWSMGNLGNLPYNQLIIMICLMMISLLICLFIKKELNGLLLGEAYAKGIGINTSQLKFIIIILATVMTGIITTLVGPISFVGLAVPHISRQFYRTLDHKVLLVGTSIIGALLLMLCDIVAQVPFQQFSLPINSITSLFGGPLVIWILIKRKHLLF